MFCCRFIIIILHSNKSPNEDQREIIELLNFICDEFKNTYRNYIEKLPHDPRLNIKQLNTILLIKCNLIVKK